MMRVMVVEDDAATRNYVVALLRKRLKVDAVGTESAEELMAAAHAGELSLVVMDVSLGHTSWQGRPVNGVQLTRMLKADPRTAAIPVLIATAHAMLGDAQRILAESGAEGYVSKPIEDVPDFLARVENLARKAA